MEVGVRVMAGAKGFENSVADHTTLECQGGGFLPRIEREDKIAQESKFVFWKNI